MKIIAHLYKRSGFWSLGRSPVPPKLVDMGVPEHLWNSTYDQVVAHNTQLSKLLKEVDDEKKRLVWLGLQISTIFAFLLFFSFDGVHFATFFLWYIIGTILLITLVLPHNPKQKAWFDSKKQEGAHVAQNWVTFIGEQNDLYQPFGIKVSAIRDKTSKKLIVGGICMVQKVNNPAFNYDAANGKGDNLLKNLESLDRLFQSGSLTHVEFSRAKEHILNESSASVALPVPNTSLVTYAEAIVAADSGQATMEIFDDETGKDPQGTSSSIEIV